MKRVGVTKSVAARLLSIGPSEVQRLIFRGLLDARLVGRRWIISTASLKEFVSAGSSTKLQRRLHRVASLIDRIERGLQTQ